MKLCFCWAYESAQFKERIFKYPNAIQDKPPSKNRRSLASPKRECFRLLFLCKPEEYQSADIVALLCRLLVWYDDVPTHLATQWTIKYTHWLYHHIIISLRCLAIYISTAWIDLIQQFSIYLVSGWLIYSGSSPALCPPTCTSAFYSMGLKQIFKDNRLTFDNPEPQCGLWD